MKLPMASMAERWLALRQKLHSRDEQRFYLEWVVVAVLALSTLSLVTVMQWGMAPGHIVYDQFHRWRAPLPSNDIVIIGIDDASLDELGGWPLKRKVYADLLQKLADTNNLPKAIGFDILFPTPVLMTLNWPSKCVATIPTWQSSNLVLPLWLPLLSINRKRL